MIGSKHWRHIFRFGLVLLVGLMVFVPSVADACPMCKSAIAEDDSEPRAYMVSILFMMGMMGGIGGGMAFLLSYVNRSEQAQLAQLENFATQPAE